MIRHWFAGLAVALASWLAATPVHAQNSHSWVSSTGSGSACTRAAPCGDLNAAHAATLAGGVISLLDPGELGFLNMNLTITKSITVRAEGVDGGATVSLSLGNWITVQAGPNDVVTLEGLQLTGSGGILFNSGAHLHVVRCVIARGNASGMAGVRFQPNGQSKLGVTDTVISNMGSGTGGGIVINPQSGGTAQVALERVTVNGNAFGIAADGSNSVGGINMTIADSMIANNTQDGIVATTSGGGAPIGIYVKNTKSMNNNFGIRSIGPNVTVRVDGSSATGNATGLSFSAGGALLTAGNNMVRANGIDGAFSGPVALQ